VSENRRFAYQPALDGVRAFAVLSVLAYHLDAGWAQGGFLGVDAFFVLSGFLITSLLIGEFARHGGISFAGFWARRARRLLPALLLVLLAVAAYGVLAAPADQLDRLRGDGPPHSSTARTGASSRRGSRTSICSPKPRRCGTCGRWRSRSSSTSCGR
jgi:peptidoglycan/LPS O-acetylase OafA/YrhL